MESPKSKTEIRGKLLLRGLTVSSFAEKHGFPISTVDKAIKLYSEGKPLVGDKTNMVINLLNEELAVAANS